MIKKLKGIFIVTILNIPNKNIMSDKTTDVKNKKYTEKKYNISNKTLFCLPLNILVIYFTNTYIFPFT
ncbi:MAG: hypothetical protein E6257_15000, partial [Clostridium botulinum]|nr:hypothetical protein [Clostridium botulinum]